MTDICIISLIGIPASGKTTFSHHLKHVLTNDDERKLSVTVVCFDDFDDFNDYKYGWKSKRREIFEHVEKSVVSLRNESKPGTPPTIIILDDNMYYRSMRYEYLKLARTYNLGYCQIFFESDLESALKLNKNRANLVPDDIIINMFEKIEKPDPTKFNWEKNSISITACSEASSYLKELKNLIDLSLRNPVQITTEVNKVPVSQSDFHLADLALRRVVSEKINLLKAHTVIKEEIAKSSLELTRMKQDVIRSLKEGHIILPDSEGIKALSDEEKMKGYFHFFCTFF